MHSSQEERILERAAKIGSSSHKNGEMLLLNTDVENERGFRRLEALDYFYVVIPAKFVAIGNCVIYLWKASRVHMRKVSWNTTEWNVKDIQTHFKIEIANYRLSKGCEAVMLQDCKVSEWTIPGENESTNTKWFWGYPSGSIQCRNIQWPTNICRIKYKTYCGSVVSVWTHSFRQDFESWGLFFFRRFQQKTWIDETDDVPTWACFLSTTEYRRDKNNTSDFLSQIEAQTGKKFYNAREAFSIMESHIVTL